MSAVSREQLRALMGEVLEAQGKSLPADESADLQTIGFRSLDFSELALRVEDEIDEELNFDAAGLRQITTVGDVLDLLDRDPAGLRRRRQVRRRGERPGRRPHRRARPRGRSCPTSSCRRRRPWWPLVVRRAARRLGARAHGCGVPGRRARPDGAEPAHRAARRRLQHRRRRGRRAPTAPREPEAGRLWLLTSGSTGRPKRIGHTLQSLTTVSAKLPPRRWLCPYSPGTYAWWQVVTLGARAAPAGPGRGRPGRPRGLGRGRRRARRHRGLRHADVLAADDHEPRRRPRRGAARAGQPGRRAGRPGGARPAHRAVPEGPRSPGSTPPPSSARRSWCTTGGPVSRSSGSSATPPTGRGSRSRTASW